MTEEFSTAAGKWKIADQIKPTENQLVLVMIEGGDLEVAWWSGKYWHCEEKGLLDKITWWANIFAPSLTGRNVERS